MADSRRLRIAILGTRGVPARYGGFETFAEELGARLVDRGHEVTVYARAHVVPAGVTSHRGVAVRRLPTIQHKYLDTVAHTAISATDALARRFDVALVCNTANAPIAWLPRVFGTQVVLNVDGLEWQRKKWGIAGRGYYRACSWLAPRLPVTLVSDAQVVAAYYRTRHGARSVYIPYGSDPMCLPPGETLRRFNVNGGRYLLYVSRLEPENNADLVIAAYARAGAMRTLGVPLLLVGDAPYSSQYKAQLQSAAAATPGVIMAGYVFGEGYAELQSNCLAYIQATEVGGTHPALVEAMGRGAAIIANDVPEHREVLGQAGVWYHRNDPSDLAARLTELVRSPDLRARLGMAARERAAVRYSWEHVADEYERLFIRLLRARLTRSDVR